MDEKLDRRTKRTKIALKNHFMELLKIKPIQKITVTELCDIVDINRSTFYKHYFDLYALLEDIEKDFYHQIDLLMEDIIAQPLKPQHVSRRILQYILENKEILYLFIYKNNGENFWNQINEKVFYLFREKTLQAYIIPDHIKKAEFEDTLLFITYGCYAIYRKWIINNCQENLDPLANRITQLSEFCLNSILILKPSAP